MGYRRRPVASRPCNFHPTVHFHVADLSLSLSLSLSFSLSTCPDVHAPPRPRTHSSLRDMYRWARRKFRAVLLRGQFAPFLHLANHLDRARSIVGCKGWICEVGRNVLLHDQTWKLYVPYVLRGNILDDAGISSNVEDSRITRSSEQF